MPHPIGLAVIDGQVAVAVQLLDQLRSRQPEKAIAEPGFADELAVADDDETAILDPGLARLLNCADVVISLAC